MFMVGKPFSFFLLFESNVEMKKKKHTFISTGRLFIIFILFVIDSGAKL